MDRYFIDTDADGDQWVWRFNGANPIPVLCSRLVRDPDLWDAIVELVEGEK